MAEVTDEDRKAAPVWAAVFFRDGSEALMARTGFECAHAIQRARAEKTEADNERLREALPDDIRAAGWTVAIHNDYRLNGDPYTFWLFTKDDRAIKGEGQTDAEALGKVRALLSDTTNQKEMGE